MWVIIVFGTLIALFSFLMISDAIVYRNYPISDQYWLTGLCIISFLAIMISMILG
jgi:hypothetical protein